MTSSSPEYNVFVSYSRKNKDLAERLDGYLKAWKAIVPDLRYFIDSKLDLGDKVTPTIEKALSDSCVYLLIATPKYF